MQKPPLSFWQVWNMSFGFMGIYFGWSLQRDNMSALYNSLGAQDDQIAWLWIAAPLTGLLVQPIIGSLSDRTWGPLGRRRPYCLAGAVLSSLALLILPHSSSLMMAAGLLWMLDASINVSMVPFRAFVVDKLPESQRARGFAMQSVLIGLGAVVAGLLPSVFSGWLHVPKVDPAQGVVPPAVRYSFYLGAAAFLGAVLWTVFTTGEYPPDDLDEFRRLEARRGGFVAGAREIFDAIGEMPHTMRHLAAVQFFTWLGLFCMWIHFTPAVAHNLFGATDPKSAAYTEGVAWAGKLSATYSAVAFLVAFGLVAACRRTTPNVIHTLCLLCGGTGLLSIGFIHEKHLLFASMLGVGIAWASILSMPYAILAGALPPGRTGVYLGLFNCFIVFPEMVASVCSGWVMNHGLNNNRTLAVMAGGVFMLIAAILMQAVPVGPEPITVRADEDELVPEIGEAILPA